MWKYILIWTLTTITDAPCPRDKDAQPRQFGIVCNMRHLSYSYSKECYEDTNMTAAFNIYNQLKKTEVMYKQGYLVENVSKISIDSVLISPEQ